MKQIIAGAAILRMNFNSTEFQELRYILWILKFKEKIEDVGATLDDIGIRTEAFIFNFNRENNVLFYPF